MLKDKINICFDDSRLDDLDLLSLPFKSTYRVLSWSGPADGTLLTADFNIADLVGKIMVIKSFKVIPYYSDDSIDLYVTDGVTINAETIPILARIDRLFDVYGLTAIVMNINGGQVNLFSASFPLDVDLQNIYYKYPEKIQTLTLAITGTIFGDIQAQTIQTPNLKVNMEVYLI